MRYEVAFDIKKLDHTFGVLLKGTREMVNRATFEALKTGRTVLKRKANEIYTIKQKDFESFVRIRNNSIVVRSKPFTSVHFASTPKGYKSMEGIKVSRRPKATLTALREKKSMVKGGFVMNPSRVKGGNVMLWQRTGKYKPAPSKTPKGRESRAQHGEAIAKPVRRTSAAQIASNEEVYKPVMEAIQNRMAERLEYHYKRMK